MLLRMDASWSVLLALAAALQRNQNINKEINLWLLSYQVGKKEKAAAVEKRVLTWLPCGLEDQTL